MNAQSMQLRSAYMALLNIQWLVDKCNAGQFTNDKTVYLIKHEVERVFEGPLVVAPDDEV